MYGNISDLTILDLRTVLYYVTVNMNIFRTGTTFLTQSFPFDIVSLLLRGIRFILQIKPTFSIEPFFFNWGNYSFTKTNYYYRILEVLKK